MKLPETSDLLLPMLKIMADGQDYHLQDLSKILAQTFQFSSTGEIKDRTLDAQFYSRVVGARSYMTQAMLLESPRRGISRLSERGQELLDENPETLTIKSLTRYPEFLEYLKSSTSENIQDYVTKEKSEGATVSNGSNGSGTNGSGTPAANALKSEPAVEASEELAEDQINGSIPDSSFVEEQVEIVNDFASEVTAEDQYEHQTSNNGWSPVEEDENEADDFDWTGDGEPLEPIEISAEIQEEIEAPSVDFESAEDDQAIGFEMNNNHTDELEEEQSESSENGNITEVGENAMAHQSDSVEANYAINHNDLTVTSNTIPTVQKQMSQKEVIDNVPLNGSPAAPETNNHEPAEEQALIPVESRVAKAAQPINAPAEKNDSLVQFFDQLKMVSQLNSTPQQIQMASQPLENEKLSPRMFTLLILMRFLENWFQNFWLYLIPFVLMLGAYGASFFILEDEFVSKGVLFVQTETLIDQVASLGDDNVNFFLSPSEQTADEIVELLNTDSFIRLIISQTPTLEAEMAKGDKIVRETIADVRESIAVNITGSNNVEVAVSWTDQEIAWKTATAAMNSYIEWKITSDKRDSFAAREFLENLVPQYENEYRSAVQGLEEFLVQNPEPFRGERPEIEQLQINQLEVAAQTAFDRFQSASDNLEQIRLEEVIIEGKTRQSYTIVDSPKIPVEEEGGLVRKIVTAAVFVTLGVVLSLLAIIFSTLFDRSLRFPIESPSAIGMPVLSSVDRIKNIDQLSGEGV